MTLKIRTGLASANKLTLVVAFLLSVFVAVYGEMFYEVSRGYHQGDYFGLITSSISIGVIARTTLLFIVCISLFFILSKKGKRIPSLLYRYRYLAAAVILALCTTFEISNSSIACWAPYLNETGTAGTVFGIPRAIRSDEWLVNVPIYLSQAFNNWDISSSILRAAETNTTMPIYAPSWSLATVFHPFQWGYLLFGPEKGMAFDWTASRLALFLVSFECAMLYTRRSKTLSLAAAVLLSFSPMMLWWGSGTSIVFGQALVLVLHRFLNKDGLGQKILSSSLLAWLAGCYLMILYPAWIVPFFFVFALFGIWVILEHASAHKAHHETQPTFHPKRDLAILGTCIVAVAALVVLVFADAQDALTATSSTVYPSGRVSTGGGLLDQLFIYGADLFLPLSIQPINASELSVVFTLFPLGLIAGCIAAVKHKDRLSAMLVILELVFLAYGIFGFPEWLSKITLFSYIPTQRLLLPLGCIDVFLLIRTLSDHKPLCSQKAPCGAIAGIIAASLSFICLLAIPFETVLAEQTAMLIAVFVSAFLASLSLLAKKDRVRPLFATAICVIILTTGACVNPIQKGLAPITESGIYQAVRSVVSKDPEALWISENSVIANLCLAAGAPTINSTNMYPNLERWHKLDPTGRYEEAYNRYAHISVTLESEEPTSMNLIQEDSFGINLNWQDLDKLDATYLVTAQNYPDNPAEGIVLERLANESGFYIYKIMH